MNLTQTKITRENFDEFLEKVVLKYNLISDMPIEELSKESVSMFSDVNRHMVLSTNRVRAIGEIYGKIQKLEAAAKRFYEHTKAKALLRAGLMENREVYPDASMRKAYAETQAENDRISWEAAKSIRECIHIERQDLWDLRQKLEVVSKNLQAQAYAGG